MRPVWVYHLWKKRKKFPERLEKGQIDAYTLENALMYFFRLRKPKWYERIFRAFYPYYIFISDSVYYCVSQNHVETVLEKIKDRKYRLEVYDCDDFSFTAKGKMADDGYEMEVNWAFGVVWVLIPSMGVGHALNFYVDFNKNVKLYEPQTNESYDEFPPDWVFYMAVI